MGERRRAGAAEIALKLCAEFPTYTGRRKQGEAVLHGKRTCREAHELEVITIAPDQALGGTPSTSQSVHRALGSSPLLGTQATPDITAGLAFLAWSTCGLGQ